MSTTNAFPVVSAAEPPETVLRAGAAKVRITPPLGTFLAGYPQRTSAASGVYDDTWVRAVVIEAGGVRYVVCSLDVMAVETEWATALRERARSRLGIEPDHLLIAATHTHSGQGQLFSFPGPLGPALDALFGVSEGEFDPVETEHLLRQALTAIEVAFTNLRPTVLRIGRDAASGIASNRVDGARDADSRCRFVSFEDPNGGVIASMIHFPCHPTVLGDSDSGISRDFPGVACDVIEQTVGGTALFLNGALGDISTRFSRRASDYSEVVRFGLLLAGAALRAFANREEIASPELVMATATVRLPAKGPDWAEGAQQRVERLTAELEAAVVAGLPHGRQRQLRTALQGAEIAVALSPRLAGIVEVPVEVQRFGLGQGVEFVACPAELFSDLGRELEASLPGRSVAIVGPANGYVGYIPTKHAFEAGGYEADASVVAPGAGEMLVAAAAELFRAVNGGGR